VLQAWNDIDQYYVVTDSIDHKKMAYAAIKSMVDSLGDTGTAASKPPSSSRPRRISCATRDGRHRVYLSGGTSSRFASTPSFQLACLQERTQPGDWIVGVDGQDVTGKTIDQVRPLITGKVGTPVKLTIIRPSQSKTVTSTSTIVTRHVQPRRQSPAISFPI